MRRALLIAAAVVSMAQILRGQTPPVGLPAEWRAWQLVAPIGAGDAGLVAVVVPVEVTGAAAPGWADLRVVDDEGRETPYVLRARSGGSTADWRDARLVEQSEAAGQFTQVVIDAGAESRVHNAARLNVGTADDFLMWVEVAASDDARGWRVVKERTPIYQLASAGTGDHTMATYPDIISRYTRFRLLDGSRRHEIRGVRIAARLETLPELTPAAVPLSGRNEADRSIWVSQPAAAHLPMAGVRFTTAQPAFLRVVVVERSDDGERWQRHATGDIYRMMEGGQTRTSFNVQIPEQAAPYWRVTVYNRNDAPIQDLTPTLETIPRRVIFRRETGRSYRLIYANSHARAPQYEMARLTDAATLDAAPAATLGEARQNANYRDSAPWTERHPLALWTALGVAVASLALLAVRTLRSA